MFTLLRFACLDPSCARRAYYCCKTCGPRNNCASVFGDFPLFCIYRPSDFDMVTSCDGDFWKNFRTNPREAFTRAVCVFCLRVLLVTTLQLRKVWTMFWDSVRSLLVAKTKSWRFHQSFWLMDSILVSTQTRRTLLTYIAHCFETRSFLRGWCKSVQLSRRIFGRVASTLNLFCVFAAFWVFRF